MLKNSQTEFGWLAKIIHWITTILVLLMFILGLWMVELEYYDSWYTAAPYYHKSVGFVLLLILCFRLFWRLSNPLPSPPLSHTYFEKIAARLTHQALYIMMFSVTISGYLISTADGRGIEVFGLFTVPALISGLTNQADIAGNFHQWLAYSLIGLSALHASAALKHHFIDKDETLTRMI